MKAFQEITEWSWPNHVYFLSDSKDKMYGYVKASTGEIQEMTTPYKFKVSGRKFKEVNNTWGFFPREEFVKGIKGEEYTVNEHLGTRTCTCPGFKFRGKCRHTDAA